MVFLKFFYYFFRITCEEQHTSNDHHFLAHKYPSVFQWPPYIYLCARINPAIQQLFPFSPSIQVYIFYYSYTFDRETESRWFFNLSSSSSSAKLLSPRPPLPRGPRFILETKFIEQVRRIRQSRLHPQDSSFNYG